MRRDLEYLLTDKGSELLNVLEGDEEPSAVLDAVRELRDWVSDNDVRLVADCE